MTETVLLILGSAGAGALVSSFFGWLGKRAELERQDMAAALKMAELKHQQIVVTHEWYAQQGKDANVSFWDPFMSVIGYVEAMREWRRTGKWVKGEAHHKPKGAV
jgi:hypothetical protein